MKKKNHYYVIGGQYESYCCGGTPTLLGAKRLASKHWEYWDNWQGWHKPAIYRAEDTMVVESRGRITTPDGWDIRIPTDYPCAEWDDVNNRWVNPQTWEPV